MFHVAMEIAENGGEWFYTSVGTVSPDALREMRDWIKDCEWSDLDTDCEELSARAIINGIHRHFDGGIPAFLLSLAPILVHSDYGTFVKQR